VDGKIALAGWTLLSLFSFFYLDQLCQDCFQGFVRAGP
jgi:hypothetical protein